MVPCTRGVESGSGITEAAGLAVALEPPLPLVPEGGLDFFEQAGTRRIAPRKTASTARFIF
jgi:hypothetical protein